MAAEKIRCAFRGNAGKYQTVILTKVRDLDVWDLNAVLVETWLDACCYLGLDLSHSTWSKKTGLAHLDLIEVAIFVCRCFGHGDMGVLEYSRFTLPLGFGDVGTAEQNVSVARPIWRAPATQVLSAKRLKTCGHYLEVCANVGLSINKMLYLDP